MFSVESKHIARLPSLNKHRKLYENDFVQTHDIRWHPAENRALRETSDPTLDGGRCIETLPFAALRRDNEAGNAGSSE